ncbi:MAG: hypothetical protein A2806_03835 [Candidatus Terrybacteria bacterium RIFCSPHIGHO2_01_FULL_48_17]|uniref:Glycosyltransferase 2-like domain-containing protein n=1 Tax=Candidatus Terrybacteria bacterium RIFCSPHIGHO2_01_FULL_48_17 TaxID=1802362 RepID=A0A1G2PIH2_9BACT|nr:MAG: hypothetical protein A2806_03835 [Candidatus Terrybacteria bacterium RIFCSPHIGHO2_01_FULL_48_17]OHA53200.1 MAG: hypothetical protein A3A30_04485 [Candidatus Terrybacteria bacterium RIFCSPLOWO2_01_FULL_48_14]
MLQQPLVTITLLNCNDRRTIFHAVDSVADTHYPNLELILIDNNSTDGTREELESRIPQWTAQRAKNVSLIPYPLSSGWFHFIKNNENVGFARGHNQAIRMAGGEFILCLNADAILTPIFVGEALKPFSDERVGAVQGKLVRYDFAKNAPRTQDQKQILDTTGLLILKNRRVVNRGQGEKDNGQYEKQEEVFGADGAVPVYRKKALNDVAVPLLNIQHGTLNDALVEFFDEDFFLYKEDVDLAWRLRIAAYKTIYEPKALAYHGRGSGDSMALSPLAIIRERRKINPRAKFFSFRNQRLMQLKDEYPSIFFRHLYRMFPKECAAWGYALLFEGTIVPRALRDWVALIPRMLKKRRFIMSRRRASVQDLTRWFV